MVTAAITFGCVVAVVTAGTLVVLLRSTKRTPSPLTGDEPLAERLAVTVGRTGGMLLGAYLAGVLTIGAGSRLMMRIVAVTSPADVHGLRTESEAVIGDVTVVGSMFLVVLFGIGSGLAGLVLFATLRRWLPQRSAAAGLFGVAIGAGLLVRPARLISADNRDFALVAPVGLAVALCMAVIVLFGATFGVLVDRLAARWPRPSWSIRGVASVLPYTVVVLSLPLLVATVLAVALGTYLPAVRRAAAQPDLTGTGWGTGRILVSVAAVLGVASVVVAAGQVLVV